MWALLLQAAPAWVHAKEMPTAVAPLHDVSAPIGSSASVSCSKHHAFLTAWEGQNLSVASDSLSGLLNEDERCEMHALSVAVDVLPPSAFVLIPWTATELPDPWIAVPHRPPKPLVL